MSSENGETRLALYAKELGRLLCIKYSPTAGKHQVVKDVRRILDEIRVAPRDKRRDILQLLIQAHEPPITKKELREKYEEALRGLAEEYLKAVEALNANRARRLLNYIADAVYNTARLTTLTKECRALYKSGSSEDQEEGTGGA